MTEFLSNDWSPPAIVAKLFWVVQLGLMIHVFKTGRPFWWFWVLLMAPVLGGIVYLFVEVLPEARASGGGGRGFSSFKPRAWRIRELRNELEERDVVKTRLALADELLEAGRVEEAHEVGADALQGVFRDDPHALLSVARYKLENQRAEEALELIERADVSRDRILAQRATLLRGRALLELRRHDEAEQCFRALDGKHVGEAHRYFLGETLHATERSAEALTLWRDILKRYRRATPSWRRSEKQWYRRAKERVKQSAA